MTQKYLVRLMVIYNKYAKYKTSIILLMLTLYSLGFFLSSHEESNIFADSESFISTENVIKPLDSPFDDKTVSEYLSEIKSSYITISYESLLIISDQDFIDNGFNGSGTEEDPYIIENYQIVVPHLDYALQIKLTTKHFIVRNCFFEARQNGLFISNTAQGTAQVINNTFVKCSEYGLFVDFSPSCKIINNTCIDNDVGIQLVASGSSNITLNSCENNLRYGISISTSTYTTINDNSLINNGFFIYEANIANYLKYFIYNNSINSKDFGYCTNIENQIIDSVDYGQMFLLNCINITVLDIDVSNSNLGVLIFECVNTTLRNIHSNNNWNGMQITNSEKITITNCSVKNGKSTAIKVQNVNNLTLSNNTINSQSIGLILTNMDYSNISDNLFLSSVDYGVYVSYGSDNNIFYRNIFAGNRGGNIQASDFGINNMWYEESLLHGNCWSDWSEIGNYSIEGSAGSFDVYPTKYDDLLPPTLNSVECNYLVENSRIAIKSRIVDDVKVDTVICTYRIQGEIWTSSIGNYLGASLYVNNIFAQNLAYQTTIQYYFEFNDTSGKVSLSTVFEYKVDSSEPSNPQLEEIPQETVPSMYNLTWSPSIDLDGYIVSYIVEQSDNTGDWENSAAYARWEINNVTYLTIQLYSVILGADPIQLFRVRAIDNDDLLSDWSNIVYYEILENDQDRDNMPDDWENLYGLNPLVDDSSLDLDGDGLTNLEEYWYSTDPNDSDSDDDGLTDSEEVNVYLTDPNDSDTDSDSIPDGWEVTYGLNPLVDDSSLDLDGDGLTNIQEYQISTKPNESDSDSDGLSDGEEVITYFTNPNSADSDNDGLNDYDEVKQYLTDPNNPDTDGDGLTDGYEVLHGFNPLVYTLLPIKNIYLRIGAYTSSFIVIIISSIATILVVRKSRTKKLKEYISFQETDIISLNNLLVEFNHQDEIELFRFADILTPTMQKIVSNFSFSNNPRKLSKLVKRKISQRIFNEIGINTLLKEIFESFINSTDKLSYTAIKNEIDLLEEKIVEVKEIDTAYSRLSDLKLVLNKNEQMLTMFVEVYNVHSTNLSAIETQFNKNITEMKSFTLACVAKINKLETDKEDSLTQFKEIERIKSIEHVLHLESRVSMKKLLTLLDFQTTNDLEKWLLDNISSVPYSIEEGDIVFKTEDDKAEIMTAIDSLLEEYEKWSDEGKGKKT